MIFRGDGIDVPYFFARNTYQGTEQEQRSDPKKPKYILPIQECFRRYGGSKSNLLQPI
jgi:hypothetical protein